MKLQRSIAFDEDNKMHATTRNPSSYQHYTRVALPKSLWPKLQVTQLR
jgi:hypothetical protein